MSNISYKGELRSTGFDGLETNDFAMVRSKRVSLKDNMLRALGFHKVSKWSFIKNPDKLKQKHESFKVRVFVSGTCVVLCNPIASYNSLHNSMKAIMRELTNLRDFEKEV